MDHEEKLPSEEYQYGFKNEDVSILKTKKGLTEETIRDISRYKHEPEWMLEFRTWLREWLPKPLFNLSKAIMRRRGYTFFSDNQ